MKIRVNKNIFHISFKKIFFKLQVFEFGNVSLKRLLGLKSEIELYNFFLKNKKNYKNICDVGANVGMHSIFLSKIFNSVSAYEPLPLHLKSLKFNKKINKLSNLKIYSKAVSTSNGNATLNVMKKNTTATHLDNSTRTKYGKIEKIRIKTSSLNELCKKHDLFKLDIEGFEGKLLKNLKFKKNFPDFLVEVHNSKNAKEIYEKFKSIKLYKMYILKNNRNILINNYRKMPKFSTDGTLFIKYEEKKNIN